MKERILNDVMHLFMQYGVKSVTLGDISQRLSISKKTIYQYFKDKEDLVDQVLQKSHEMDKDQILEVKNKSEDAMDEVFLMTDLLRDKLNKTNSSMIFDIQKYYPKIWVKVLDHIDQCHQSYVVQNIERGKEEGVFRKEINSVIVAKLRLKMIEFAFDFQQFPLSEYKMKEVQLNMLEVYIFGIVTPKGYELYKNYIDNH